MPQIDGQHPLFDLTPPGADQRGFRGPFASAVAGISYRQLDYWARTRLGEPSLRGAHGQGSQCLYSFADVVALAIVKRLLGTGVSLANIRTALATLRAHEPGDLAVLALLAAGSGCTWPAATTRPSTSSAAVKPSSAWPSAGSTPTCTPP